MMYALDPSALPFLFVAAMLTGFGLTIPFKNVETNDRFDNLESRISELERELEEKNTKLSNVRNRLVEALSLFDDDYDDMPPLVPN
jgi:uncharacterized protein YydD (DUF2326 family)